MKRVLALLLFYSPLFSFATTWLVGPGKIHSKPSDVAALVNAGDTVEIDAAEYIGDVCAWTKDNLVLRGVAGRPHLRANGNNVWGKGIWVFAGNNISVDNIEFSEATVPDQNGAGIRLDGLGITVTNCYFHNNENGILTANNGGTLRIDNSEFGYNGFGDGFSHNIYIGHVDTAIIRFCYFHHANIGHELKSRARVNYILYNRISNEATGTASREIDLPNGGISILIGNIIQQGANSQNGNMIGYGLEGLTNIAPHEIYLINNTMVNERFAGSFLVAADNTQYVKAYNNIFAGPGTGITYGGSSVLDVSNNIQNNTIATMGFVNPGNYDYHVSNTSPAINAGINAGNSVGGFVLTPGLEYIHPVSFAAKAIQGTIDIGAYEFATALPVKILSFDAKKQSQQIVLQWQTANEESIDRYEINKSNDGFIFFKIGEILPKGKIINHYKWADKAGATASFYKLKISNQDGSNQYSKVIIVNAGKAATVTKALIKDGSIYILDLPERFQQTNGTLQLRNSAGALLFQQKLIYPSSPLMVLQNLPLSAKPGTLLVTLQSQQEKINIWVLYQ